MIGDFTIDEAMNRAYCHSMTMNGNKISREGAVNALKRLFGDVASDAISLEEMYANADRTNESLERNKAWRYNVLSRIRPYNLFEEVYGTKNGARVTTGIKLTDEGRRAIRSGSLLEDSTAKSPTRGGEQVSFAIVRDGVIRLRELYPELEITFEVGLRK